MIRRNLAAALLVCAVALGACTHASSTGSGAVGSTTTSPHETLVAFGSSSAVGSGLTYAQGLRDSWPQLLFREAFPLSTVFINLSADDSSIDNAVSLELQTALEQRATIAAIWLGPDGEGGCTPDTTATRFEPALTSLLQPLRASGVRVIIGNVPDRVPCAVAFNAAVVNVARAQDATVADVASALASTPTVGPSSSITIPESRAIAAAFAAAEARSTT